MSTDSILDSRGVLMLCHTRASCQMFLNNFVSFHFLIIEFKMDGCSQCVGKTVKVGELTISKLDRALDLNLTSANKTWEECRGLYGSPTKHGLTSLAVSIYVGTWKQSQESETGEGRPCHSHRRAGHPH